MENTYSVISWNEASYYIEASSICNIKFGEDLCSLHLDLGYCNIIDHEFREAFFNVMCLNIAYLDVRRLDGHTPGSGSIYEAYLHESSSLIDSFLTNKLESKAGSLILQSNEPTHSLWHFEIVGEISVNVICEEVRVETATAFPPEWRSL